MDKDKIYTITIIAMSFIGLGCSYASYELGKDRGYDDGVRDTIEWVTIPIELFTFYRPNITNITEYQTSTIPVFHNGTLAESNGSSISSQTVASP